MELKEKIAARIEAVRQLKVQREQELFAINVLIGELFRLLEEEPEEPDAH